jgi:hypothetical protein
LARGLEGLLAFKKCHPPFVENASVGGSRWRVAWLDGESLLVSCCQADLGIEVAQTLEWNSQLGRESWRLALGRYP